jgi:23S rRNA (uracil1939-C5)-methyltransferase
MTTSIWPATLELTLDGIAQGGEGVGRWNDRVVFARGGLPGERVRVSLTERHESYAHALVAEVLEFSPDRVPPRQPNADHMPWQHIAYPAQLRYKRQILADQLAKIGGLDNVVDAETIAAPRPWNYRNSARFHGQGQRIGYYAADSRDLREVTHDPLLLPVLNDALVALHAVVQADMRAPPEIVLRASEAYGYALAVLHGAAGADLVDLRRLAGAWRMRCPALAGVALVGHSAAGRPVETLGADQLIEELGGIAFHLHPTGFFQVNAVGAEKLLELVRRGLELRGHERLLDLYCGAGAFALPLAGAVSEVLGIEEYAGAVEDARATAVANGVANVHFEIGRVEMALTRLDEAFDAVVLDPPRRGCHPQALAELVRLAPTRIVYVSCHPATLARDLKRLVAGGYHVARVQPVDLFPQTVHIESVAILEQE